MRRVLFANQAPFEANLPPCSFVRLFRHPTSFVSYAFPTQLEEGAGRRGGRGRCTRRCVALRFECPGACRRCSRFISRCSRSFFIATLVWVDSRHVCHEVATSGVRDYVRGLSWEIFVFFQPFLYFITLDITLLRETAVVHAMEKCIK